MYIKKPKGMTLAICSRGIRFTGYFKLFLLSAYRYLTRSKLEIDQMTSPYRLLLFTCRI
jgi:hypothetical protein